MCEIKADKNVLSPETVECVGIVWHKRIVSLAVDRVMYANADDPNRTVLDYIKYENMVECEQKRDEDDPTLTEIIFGLKTPVATGEEAKSFAAPPRKLQTGRKTLTRW